MQCPRCQAENRQGRHFAVNAERHWQLFVAEEAGVG
jgi:hypothetical protein